jgi:PST family polysaccharide transporter
MNSTNKRLINNFLSLAVLQGTNYILPLITFPYLVRVLGPSNFGLIAFSQALINFFVVLTDYGFNLSATKQIAVNRDSKENISSIFSTVFLIKSIFATFYFFILVAIVFSIEKLSQDWDLYLISYGMVIGSALFPVWFFQGMENMKYISLLNICSKMISTVAIFLFIKEENDYLFVPLFNSLSAILVGTISVMIVFRKFNVIITFRSFRERATKHIIDGWHVFISMIAINLFTASNTIILGLFTNNTIVGYYASGEKIVKAIQGLLTPVAQTVYPYINSLAAKSKEAAFTFIKKILLLICSITLLVSATLFLSADFMVPLILGHEYTNSIIVVKILSLLPFMVGLSNLFGIQTMLTFNMKKEYSKIYISAGLLNIALALTLVPFLKYIGTGICVIVTEIIIVISMFIVLYKKGFKFMELSKKVESK